MNKLIFPLALLGMSYVPLLAQPTLQMNVVGQIGDVVTLQVADTLNISQGNAGANQTWNFSSLKPQSGQPATLYAYLAPANTPPQFASVFPVANLSLKIGTDTAVYSYGKLEANQFTFLGIKNDFIEQVYTDPDIQLKTLTYNNSFSDDFANYSNAGGGVIFYGKGSRTVTYDGYGTLITPLGTFQNAMRIKGVSNQVDSAEFSGVKIINRTNIVTYDWFVATQPGALVSVYYTRTITETYFFPGLPPNITDLGTTKSVNYLSNLTSSAFSGPDQLQGLSISLAGANPAADQLALNFTATEGRENLQMLITNAGGQVVASRALAVLPGESRMDLPIEYLPAGAYFLTVTDGRGASTLKWQKL
ncbi:MAG: hypothetical protein ACOYNO_03500 [Saprospiraceae bacterium]